MFVNEHPAGILAHVTYAANGDRATVTITPVQLGAQAHVWRHANLHRLNLVAHMWRCGENPFVRHTDASIIVTGEASTMEEWAATSTAHVVRVTS